MTIRETHTTPQRLVEVQRKMMKMWKQRITEVEHFSQINRFLRNSTIPNLQ